MLCDTPLRQDVLKLDLIQNLSRKYWGMQMSARLLLSMFILPWNKNAHKSNSLQNAIHSQKYSQRKPIFLGCARKIGFFVINSCASLCFDHKIFRKNFSRACLKHRTDQCEYDCGIIHTYSKGAVSNAKIRAFEAAFFCFLV